MNGQAALTEAVYYILLSLASPGTGTASCRRRSG